MESFIPRVKSAKRRWESAYVVPPCNRWISLTAGLAVMSVSGTVYLFSVYAPDVKEKLHISQTQINTIGSLLNAGLYVTGFAQGIFYDVMGPRISIVSAALVIFLGYFLTWAAVHGGLGVSNNYILIGLYLGLTGVASGLSYIAVLAPNAENFPHRHRGKVVGCLVALFGLSGALFTQLYDVAFKPNTSQFLLFMAVCIGAIFLFGGIFVSYSSKSRQFRMSGVDAAQGRKSTKEINPLLSKNTQEERLSRSMEESIVSTNDDGDYDRTGAHIQYGGGRLEETLEDIEAWVSDERGERAVVVPWMLVTYLDYWLLLLAFGIGSGAGLTAIGNIGSQWLSLGGVKGGQNIPVILFSVADTLGRASFGLCSDACRTVYSRGLFLTASVAMMALGMGYLAFANRYMIYFAIIVVAFAYSGLFSIGPMMCYELYGSRYFGTNWSTFGIASGVFSYLFSSLLAGTIYDNHVHSHSHNKCYGVQCYQVTYLILFGLCLVAVAACAMLTWRTRRFYNKKRHRCFL